MNPKDSNTYQQIHPEIQMQDLQSAPSCPMCGDENVSTSLSHHAFDYGSEGASVELQVRVPVHRCGACQFEYLDDTAERLKHNAVCDHLGVLSPDRIRCIREKHGMTRAAFARITGLGEASLNRWENGLSIQTCANDRYLRLLEFPENMSRLQRLMTSWQSAPQAPGLMEHRFRVVKITDVIRKKQKAFRLRGAA